MRIAVASSGLGHVARGVETWALDTAAALARRGVDVTLFAAEGFQVSAFSFQVSRLPCLRRFDARTQRLVHWTLHPLWRWGLKTDYGWEQLSFWLRLWPRLRRGRFDILHVQDPMLAFWCRKFRKLGLVRTKEILAHGTEEPAEWLAQFEYVQHLAPWHLENACPVPCPPQADPGTRAECGMRSAECGMRGNEGGVSERSGAPTATERNGDEKDTREQASIQHKSANYQIDESTSSHPFWVAIPNFVDTNVFRPAKDASEKAECRKNLGIPVDAFIIGTVATVKKPHKRIDHLIREFAGLANEQINKSTNQRICHLLIAGARTPQSDELVSLAEDLAPGRIRFFFDLPREQMPAFYRAVDVFVLVSLFEMMPIAVLEALASGLPLICNDAPVLRWMVGRGGALIDMGRDGGLSEYLAEIDPPWIQTHGQQARRHALETFATDVVIGQYIAYYRSILGQR